MEKTNTGLVAYAIAQLGKPYWYGTYGKVASAALYEQKKRQYPDNYKWNYTDKEIGQKVHDCVGLIKGYLWSDSPDDPSPQFNKVQDRSANGMLSVCTETGSIKTIPEIPGLLVFFPGHVGVYIGNGYVVEARGHNYGVVKTKLSKRPWKTWGKCPFLLYGSSIVESSTEQKYRPTVKEWQLAAIADGFVFPVYGADGEWGKECESVARKAVVKKRLTYKYHNLTKIVQKVVGVTADGKCGKATAAAIKSYQSALGLEADGECGINTWRKMLGV